MKKICMLTTSEIYHDSRILNEAETLTSKYQITILARKYPEQKPAPKFPFEIKIIGFANFKSFKLNIFSSLMSLAKAAFRENPDVFHAHDLDGLLCAFPAALIKRKILVYDSHELWSESYPFENLRGIKWLLPILERILIWKVKAGITVNQSIADYLEKKYHKQFIVLYNFPHFLNKPADFVLKKRFPGEIIILHLGAADEGRGLEQILKAAKYLSSRYKIVFLGGGKTEKQIKKLATKLKLGEKTVFLPPVQPEKIVPTIHGADLGLALTEKKSLSYYLSLPNKIFYYIAAEMPVLGSNFPEFKKIIIKDKVGETVDPSKPQVIAQKIIRMTKEQNRQKYRGNLQGLAAKKYNWQIQCQTLVSFYQKLLR
ncbi:MAG: glycosyltransferase [Patescibacteria group bacterium]